MTRFMPFLPPILAFAVATLAIPALAQNQQQQSQRQSQNMKNWPPCSAQVRQGCIMPNGQFIQPYNRQQPGLTAPGMADQNLGIGDRSPSPLAPPPQ